MTRMRRASLAG